jgi:hypothetical protein
MMVKIRARTDFVTGLLFFVVGLGFAYASLSYRIGTAVQMGSGFFPLALSILLCVLGAIILLSSISPASEEQGLPSIDLKVAFFVIAPIVLFALFLQQIGFVLALFMVVICSSFASHELRWHTAITSAVALVCLSIVIFVVLLNVQVDLWPAFMG